MARPVLLVLAGVNGAGKSSVVGSFLRDEDLEWFNPDTFARELVALHGEDQERANAAAWNEGFRRLRLAIDRGKNHALETTLGGDSITAALIEAAQTTHDVIVLFCGLDSPERHVARVQARVAAGGHDIPTAKIEERYSSSRRNLIRLLPHLSALMVYDNSREVKTGKPLPNPVLLLEMAEGRLIRPLPTDLAALASAPVWAQPILEAAICLSEGRS